MKKRILALVFVVILSLSYMSVGFADGCGHGSTKTQHVGRYVWQSDNWHKYYETDTNYCTLCGQVMWVNDVLKFSDKHTALDTTYVEIRGIYRYEYKLCTYCHGHCETTITIIN